MPSTQVNVRVPDDELKLLDDLASALARERAGNVTPQVTRGDAVRIAITEAYERRRDLIAADQAAWSALVQLAGERAVHRLGRNPDEPEWAELVENNGITAMLTLRGGDEVSIQLDSQPADLPLVYEELRDSLVTVFLTDDAQRARVYLGTVSRIANSDGAIVDRRLYSLADELGLR